ncbi:MAG TPA: hypothetical protein DF383_07025 [Deltaproteobacteria bacterium]|nr:hypothetical protein [Deltaproteobacteria bacterium]
MKIQSVGLQSAMASVESDSADEDATPCHVPLPGVSFSAAPAAEQASAQWKQQVRTCIESRLYEAFKAPHLIEGLTDFLCEVLSEDPARRKLFGF